MKKNTNHHHKHQKKKAIKDANKMKDSGPMPEDMVENPNWKKQFDPSASSDLPHKERSHHKKTAKRASPKDVKSPTEPDHAHWENERWDGVVKAQNKENTQRLNKKILKSQNGKFKKTG